jgi:cell division protein FtsA
MSKEDIKVAIELGSGKVLCAVSKVSDDESNPFQVLAINEVATSGLQNGNVISIDETVSAIEKCIEGAEAQAGSKINSIYLGIKGEHIETYNHKGAVNISRSDKELTEEDRAHVLEAARQMRISNDREIIETIPQGYTVDKQKGVPNPVGMEGTHLGVNVHLVTASTMALNNIYKCVNRAGFKIDGLAYSVLAAGEVCVMPEEKELGVVLVDIGGQVTDIAIYVSGGVVYTKEIPIGGDFITRDIAYGLRTSTARAKELKELHGIAYAKLINENTKISYAGVDGISQKETTVSGLSDIIYPRVEEILEMIKEEVSSTEYANLIPAGYILTGGTAKLKGMEQAGECVLGLPVRLGTPQGIAGSMDLSTNVSYSSVLGLVKYVNKVVLVKSSRKTKTSLVGSVKKALEEIF